MMKPDEVVAALSRLGGVARPGELARHGVTRYSLKVAVRSGDVERLRPGLYALPSGLSTAARRALAHGGVLGCASAVAEAGLWVMPFSGTHVWLCAGGHRRDHPGCDCIPHWGRQALPRRYLAPVRTSVEPVVALRQLALCLGAEPFFVAYESALRLRMLSRGDSAALRASLPSSFGFLFELACSTADSGLESLVRLRLFRLGISVEGQVDVPGVGRVDLLVGDRLLIELDGKENHDGPLKRHKDLRRDALVAALGYETLRFDYGLILFEWELVEGAILAKVASGSHRSFAGMRMRSEAHR